MADDASVMKAIVFIVVFSAVFSFLYAYSSAAFMSSIDPQEDDYLVRNFSPEEIATMTFWENDSVGSGYIHSMTESTNWGTYVIEPLFKGEPSCDGSRYDFYHPTDGQHVRFYPISGNTDYEDDDVNMVNDYEGFLVYQQWGWWDKEWEWISFERVVMNLQKTDEGVKSNIHVDLKGGMNVYFIFPLGSTVDTVRVSLDVGYGFQVAIAQSIIDETNSASNAWNALTGLLTFNIDTGFWILDYLISVPIYASIAFIAFYIIKELIP
jgi:hypothetical protein